MKTFSYFFAEIITQINGKIQINSENEISTSVSTKINTHSVRISGRWEFSLLIFWRTVLIFLRTVIILKFSLQEMNVCCLHQCEYQNNIEFCGKNF